MLAVKEAAAAFDVAPETSAQERAVGYLGGRSRLGLDPTGAIDVHRLLI